MVHYSRTNESIAAVVLGLDLQPDDEVYAVGGSGDQAFVMLEYVRRVTVIDNNPKQVEFMRKRLGFLSSGLIDGFLRVDEPGVCNNVVLGSDFPEFGRFNLGRRDAYFRSIDSKDEKIRFCKIAKNAENLTILEGDFFKGLESIEPVSKMYLSNIGGLSGLPVKRGLEKIDEKLKTSGLVYFSKGLKIFHEGFLGKEFTKREEEGIMKMVEIDEILPHIASVIEANTILLCLGMRLIIEASGILLCSECIVRNSHFKALRIDSLPSHSFLTSNSFKYMAVYGVLWTR